MPSFTGRYSVQDFIAQVNSIGKTAKGNLYNASLNTDGSVQVTQNGVVINGKAWWGIRGVAVTDANPSGDSLTHSSGRTADSMTYLQGLINS